MERSLLSYGRRTRDVTTRVASRVGNRLLDLLVPQHCLGCQRRFPGTDAHLGLCPPCASGLVRWPMDGCPRCVSPTPVVPGPHRHQEHCHSCRRQPPPYDRLLAAYHYREPIDAVVTAFKFRRLEYLGRHLGEALVEAVATEIDRAGPIDAVAPIPLHPWRKLRRGFDQAARIAEPAARCLGLPYAPTALRRRRATPPQSRLGRRSRLRNLERAFVPGRGARHLRDRTVLLIDDVITTGATAAAAAHGLRRAGVGRIVVAAVARAA